MYARGGGDVCGEGDVRVCGGEGDAVCGEGDAIPFFFCYRYTVLAMDTIPMVQKHILW